MAGPLDGRRALVTGGGAGIGAAIALAFDASGAGVVATGRRLGPLEEVAGRGRAIRPVVADATDEAATAGLFAAEGPFDIVVANAGGANAAPLEQVSLEEWEATLRTNLTSVFLTFREAVRGMTGGDGRLIAIASTAALKGDPLVASYTAAKHGVLGLVRALAKETARRGITVNAICPGYVDTPLADRAVAGLQERLGLAAEEARARLAAGNPAGRLIVPEEVAAAALFLASPGASMVNGQALAVSGGEI